MYLHCSTVSVCLQPLQIKSAVAVEGLKGYIYIEAYKQTHVKQVKIIKKKNYAWFMASLWSVWPTSDQCLSISLFAVQSLSFALSGCPPDQLELYIYQLQSLVHLDEKFLQCSLVFNQWMISSCIKTKWSLTQSNICDPYECHKIWYSTEF